MPQLVRPDKKRDTFARLLGHLIEGCTLKGCTMTAPAQKNKHLVFDPDRIKTDNMTTGFLQEPEPLEAEYLQTLHAFGSLPDILTISDTAAFLAHLCQMDTQAMTTLISEAVLQQEIAFWGLSHNGGWTEGMVRALFLQNEIAEMEDGRFELKLVNPARLHLEAMGVHPFEVAAYLIAKGRKVPDALRDLVSGAGGHPSEEVEATPETAPIKHVPAQRAQENAILIAIRELGYEPSALPKWQAGRDGAKAEVRRLIQPNAPFNGRRSVFDKAWERLRNGGDIGDA